MKNKKTKKTKASIKEIFALNKEKVQSVMHTCPALFVNSLGEITIQNCSSIILYTENEICFDMKKLCVSIKGDGIVMDTMEKNMVTVHGRIFSINFLYSKENT